MTQKLCSSFDHKQTWITSSIHHERTNGEGTCKFSQYALTIPRPELLIMC